MEGFVLKNEINYVIYGAGGNCYHLIAKLEKAGKKVVAVIDKRADSLNDIQGVPVYTIEQMQAMEMRDMVIILSIKNVFIHTEIAESLISAGFHKIIYKPLPVLQGVHDEDWDSIDRAYEVLLEQDTFSEELEVSLSNIKKMRVWQNRLLIDNQEQEVTCWLPIERLYNYNRENDLFAQLPMAAYYPLIQLYNFLLGNRCELTWQEVQEDYLLYSAEWVYKRELEFTEDLKRSQIESRVQVFYEMQQNAEIDQEFFVRNAAAVKMDSEGKYYLASSGRNRVAFLIAKGYRYIPVKMEKEDYERLIAEEVYKKVLDYLQGNSIKRLFSVVPHPILREYPTVTNDYMRLFGMPVLLRIIRWLHRESLSTECTYDKIHPDILNRRKNALNIGTLINDEGMLSRIISKEKIHCYRFLSEREQKKAGLIHLVDELLMVKEDAYLQETVIQKMQENSAFDVLILDGIYSNYFEKECNAKLVFVLLWEKDTDVLKQWENNGYDGECFFTSVWDGQQVRGYQFKKR